MLFSTVSLFSKLKRFKIFILIIQIFYLIHFIFISYFGNPIQYTDIYLFFTHITETFESVTAIYDITFYPLLIVAATSFIIMYIRYEKSKISTFLLSTFLLFSLLFQDKMYDASLSLIKESAKSIFLKKEKGDIQKSDDKNRVPLHKTDNNIILVIGESMRSRENLKERYDIFENYRYKTIKSGATNTDVSVPLLINGGISPQKINLDDNLFLLAKKNGYKTSFISAQNEKSLKYIEPYLHKEHIDTFKILGSRDDKELVSNLKDLLLEDKNFIVLQMQGEHSPYIYYENSDRSDSVELRYHKSMQYSDVVLNQLINYVSSYSKKPFLFIFASDHGELIGHDGKTGHNRFEKEIYSVPLVIHSNLETYLEKLESHGDVYELMYHYLGYSKEFKLKERKKIRVYGTMITEEDGYIDIEIKDPESSSG
ncbi:MAG: sulfatase-like hydrolase/transferase [Campylobacterota bacterium]